VSLKTPVLALALALALLLVGCFSPRRVVVPPVERNLNWSLVKFSPHEVERGHFAKGWKETGLYYFLLEECVSANPWVLRDSKDIYGKTRYRCVPRNRKRGVILKEEFPEHPSSLP
jgi:hypothetical protein